MPIHYLIQGKYEQYLQNSRDEQNAISSIQDAYVIQQCKQYHSPNFKTFQDQFSISTLCMRQDFQSLFNLPDLVLSLQSLNRPVNQSHKF